MIDVSQEQLMIGVGGWAYLPIRHINKLKVCSELYDFVEVNSTFYKLPLVEIARKWRKSVPDSFEFTIRANRTLTHENHLEPTEENLRIYHKMLNLCRTLNAKILHFQFPPSFEITETTISNWRNFFRSTNNHTVNIAFEIRNKETLSDQRKKLESFYNDYDIIPTVDASKPDEEPKSSSDSKILYTRVFGLGDHTKWSFDSEELVRLKERVEKTPARKRYVTFHNLTMYEDASRMRGSVRGIVDKIMTLDESEKGTDSLRREIISSRVRYPASKAELRRELGWRTFDERPGKKVHLEKYIEKLPDRKFDSAEEVIDLIAP